MDALLRLLASVGFVAVTFINIEAALLIHDTFQGKAAKPKPDCERKEERTLFREAYASLEDDARASLRRQVI